MNPMDTRPDDFHRRLADRQAEMRRSRELARYAHSRAGLLVRHVRDLVDRIDATGRLRMRSRRGA